MTGKLYEEGIVKERYEGRNQLFYYGYKNIPIIKL
jgi:hypothetical protein